MTADGKKRLNCEEREKKYGKQIENQILKFGLKFDQPENGQICLQMLLI